MFTLNLDVSVSDDKKSIVLTDYSTGYEEDVYYAIDTITISTLLGIWKPKIVEKVISLKDNLNIGITSNMYPRIESGFEITIPVSEISEEWDFIYDDLYTLKVSVISSMTIEDIYSFEGSQYDIVSFSEILFPLSDFFVKDFTLSYNIQNNDSETEEMIVRYNTWKAMLPILAEFSDNARITEILTLFKTLTLNYGLPY